MRPPAGSLLIAEPFMEDPNFRGSVVLLCESREDGAFGLILNRPLEEKVCNLIEDFPAIENQVFYGGPVQPNTLHYLHQRGDLLPDSIEIVEGLYWGGDFQRLITLLDTGQMMANDVRFFVGYAGWDGQQIMDELAEKAWFVGKVRAAYLFEEDPTKLWRTVLRHMGERYKVIANLPDNPRLN
ncbi:MAG: YqgE/AlgH family protein [Chitinophagales bacterium]|nr:YqgE/AlgH family protein [Chitinophagales bacterium]MDW8393415.1 YqgE/AlgH family protein [Chitinophagales bacterium]